jgi:hypothetical protein
MAPSSPCSSGLLGLPGVGTACGLHGSARIPPGSACILHESKLATCPPLTRPRRGRWLSVSHTSLRRGPSRGGVPDPRIGLDASLLPRSPADEEIAGVVAALGDAKERRPFILCWSISELPTFPYQLKLLG